MPILIGIYVKHGILSIGSSVCDVFALASLHKQELTSQLKRGILIADMNAMLRDEKGKVIGRELPNGQLLDGKGVLVSRYIKSSNVTVNKRGENVGYGDQRLRQLSDK